MDMMAPCMKMQENRSVVYCLQLVAPIHHTHTSLWSHTTDRKREVRIYLHGVDGGLSNDASGGASQESLVDLQFLALSISPHQQSLHLHTRHTDYHSTPCSTGTVVTCS